MSNENSRGPSYHWYDGLKNTIFYGVNPPGRTGFKDGKFRETIQEDSDPMESLKLLFKSDDLDSDEKLVVNSCRNNVVELYTKDYSRYDEVNPFQVEYEELWEKVKELVKTFAKDTVEPSQWKFCAEQLLDIKYEFEQGSLTRMMVNLAPREELKPRLWDPKYHDDFMAAIEKQLAKSQAQLLSQRYVSLEISDFDDEVEDEEEGTGDIFHDGAESVEDDGNVENEENIGNEEADAGLEKKEEIENEAGVGLKDKVEIEDDEAGGGAEERREHEIHAAGGDDMPTLEGGLESVKLSDGDNEEMTMVVDRHPDSPANINRSIGVIDGIFR